MGHWSRQAAVWGAVFGLITVAADVVMALALPPPAASPDAAASVAFSALCASLLITSILFGLAGYVTAGQTRDREQGRAAGLVAALVNVGVDTLLFSTVLAGRAGSDPPLVMLTFGLLLNVPVGLVAGALGGALGSGSLGEKG